MSTTPSVPHTLLALRLICALTSLGQIISTVPQLGSSGLLTCHQTSLPLSFSCSCLHFWCPCYLPSSATILCPSPWPFSHRCGWTSFPLHHCHSYLSPTPASRFDSDLSLYWLLATSLCILSVYSCPVSPPHPPILFRSVPFPNKKRQPGLQSPLRPSPTTARGCLADMDEHRKEAGEGQGGGVGTVGGPGGAPPFPEEAKEREAREPEPGKEMDGKGERGGEKGRKRTRDGGGRCRSRRMEG